MYQVYVDNELICDSRVGELALIDPSVELEVNTPGSFSFIFPPEHPFYNCIDKRTSLIKVLRDGEEIFEGICTNTSDDFYKQRTVECEGSLTFFNDSVQRPCKYKNYNLNVLLTALINKHNAVCEDAKHFTLGTVTVINTSKNLETNYCTTIEALSKIQESEGGYFRVRNSNGVRYLDYLADALNTSSQTIRLGENLIDFTSSLDTTEFATVIIPLGATLEEQSEEGMDERVGIASVNDGKDYLVNTSAVSSFGWIEKVVVWDSVTSPSNLKTKGQKYLTESQYDNVVIEARAIDLHIADESIEPYKILDKIRVVSAPHGLNKYFLLTKQTINLNNPGSDSVTLGIEESKSLTTQSRADNEEILSRVEEISIPSILDSAKKNSTELIKAAGNGYITVRYSEDMHPYELLIMDTDNIDTATKVWRWNKNGLGYSSNGYYGDYSLAIKNTGEIVADFITTGTLLADRVQGGTLTLGGNNEQYGIEEVKDADGNSIVEINNSGIKINNKYKNANFVCENSDWQTKGKYKSQIDAYELKLSKEVDGENKTTFSASDGGIYGYPYEGTRYFGLDGRQLLMQNDDITFYITVQNSGSQSWPYIHANGGKIDVGVVNAVNLYCSGTKSRVADTEDYGSRLMYCYEMPSPFFGDVGSAITDNVGICVVEIDDIFSETVDLSVEYQVFLQEYGEGNVYVSKREQTYFVVEGTPNLEFGWEIKATQKDYDSMRMTEYEEEEVDEQS